MPIAASAESRGPIAAWGIVLAAGRGERFGGRKQFLTAAGHRLVDLAVTTLAETCRNTVLVLPPDTAWDGPAVDQVVPGGPDRPSSVQAALAAIDDHSGIVVVHQAANPLASAATVRRLIEAVEQGADAACPGLRPSDVVRATRGELVGDVVGRDDLILVQTPTAFRLEVLRAAHGAGLRALEDTALVTTLGYEVTIVPGDPQNIHVTTDAELQMVDALLRLREQ